MPEMTQEGLAQFDPLVAEVMAEWRILGLAMAVVRRGEPPLLRCWGQRDIDTGAPVSPDTVLPICSVTKSFTATALALLVDEGRLDWDMPVRGIAGVSAARSRRDRRGEFARPANPPHRVTAARRGAHGWPFQQWRPARRASPPRTQQPFRSYWQYNNLMYLVAGLVLERVSGERWEDFICDRILLPLGMVQATTSLEDMLARHPDRAVGYAILDGEPRRIPLRLIYARPAGGICASIAEMAAWMRFHLDPVTGRDGLRLSPAAATELTAPQIYIGPSDFAEIGRVNYCFGFFVGDYRGTRSIHHNGGPWCGYNCDLRLLPDHNSGVMVLTNGHDPGCTSLTNTVLDHMLGLEPLPWLERFRGARAARRGHA
jgi:CubicO group peptidase (beta-lactamase class C family)